MDKNIYLLTLTGQGDTEIKIVDKETFDWIFISPFGDSWVGNNEDRSCPLFIRERKYTLYYDELKNDYSSVDEFYPELAYSSYENDKAIWAPGLIGEKGEELYFFSTKEAYEYIYKNKLNIVDEYTGYIY